MKFYDLKAIYNPFDEDITIQCSSPAINKAEEYTIKSKGILLLPNIVARGAVSTISREVLRRSGKEFNDISRQKVEEELLSHNFEIRDLSGSATTEKAPKVKKGEIK